MVALNQQEAAEGPVKMSKPLAENFYGTPKIKAPSSPNEMVDKRVQKTVADALDEDRGADTGDSRNPHTVS